MTKTEANRRAECSKQASAYYATYAKATEDYRARRIGDDAYLAVRNEYVRLLNAVAKPLLPNPRSPRWRCLEGADMGCDIHCCAEIKIAGQWYTYDQPVIDRCYSLFARMANVRNTGLAVPLSDPRGLPPDVGVVTKLASDTWGVDGHSHSWLSLEEAGQLEQEFEASTRGDEKIWSPFGYLFNGCWKRSSLPTGVEDARLVFWFDN